MAVAPPASRAADLGPGPVHLSIIAWIGGEPMDDPTSRPPDPRSHLDAVRRALARAQEKGATPEVLARYGDEVQRLERWIAAGAPVPPANEIDPLTERMLISALAELEPDDEGPAKVHVPDWPVHRLMAHDALLDQFARDSGLDGPRRLEDAAREREAALERNRRQLEGLQKGAEARRGDWKADREAVRRDYRAFRDRYPRRSRTEALRHVARKHGISRSTAGRYTCHGE